MTDKMKVFALLLISFTTSGFSYVLPQKLPQVAGLDKDNPSVFRQLRDASVSADVREKNTEEVQGSKDGTTLKTNPLRKPVKNEKTSQTNPEKQAKEEKRGITKTGNRAEIQERIQGHVKGREERLTPQTLPVKYEKSTPDILEYGDAIVENGENDESREVKMIKTGVQDEAKSDETDVQFEKSERLEQGEREHKLTAGIREDTHEDEKETVEGETEDKEKRAENSREHKGREEPIVNNLTPPLSASSVQVGKESDIPATIQIITQTQNPLLLPVTPTRVPPDSSHPQTSNTTASIPPPPPPTAINLISNLTPSAGAHLAQEGVVGSVLENVKHTPAEDINAAVQPNKTSKPKFTATDFITKEPNHTPASNENKPAAKPVKSNTTAKAVKLLENKSSPSQPSAKPQLRKTTSTRPTKTNRSSKNKTIKKSKDKKKKKDNKTQKPPEKKEVTPPTHFPYFMDNYCPPECACYGRVVQCSDKGVARVPYGIPYNARYILLMNNQISSIQLDLLNEYVSMEFLVLSNNRLTDGAIEGAFEGVPALKRLYLDRNLLESVPTDLPVSLEELRLDNNHLNVMSEAAWVRCPSLLVLSLSNNSLGNGSGSLPYAVLSPLCNLRTLNLDHNQLTSMPLGLPLSIKELYLKGNHIEQFRGGAFDGVSGLVVLDLSENRLTNNGLLKDSLLNATHLESLNLEGNRLKQIPRHLPPSLKTLNLEGNLISSIKKASFSALKNLEHLGLARNKIVKVAPGAFRMLPALHQLDLCHNTLHQVPRQLPQALHSVVLSHNKIRSVPRDAFCWGDKSLSLSGIVRVQLENNLIDMAKLDSQAFRCLRGFQVVHFY